VDLAKPEANLVLTGYSGTGKSTVGRILAARWQWKFVDINAILEERENCRLARLVQVRGQEYVDRKEEELIAGIAAGRQLVVAAGARTLLSERNFLNLKQNGVLIGLTAEPGIILLRTCAPWKDRTALLKSKEVLQTIRQVIKERESFSRKPDYTIDTSELTPEQVAEKIEALLVVSKKE